MVGECTECGEPTMSARSTLCWDCSHDPRWTPEALIMGLRRFIRENGRCPLPDELRSGAHDYLPRSRMPYHQHFGGLQKAYEEARRI